MHRIQEKNINTPEYWNSRSGPAYLSADRHRVKAKQLTVIAHLPVNIKMLDVGCLGGNFRQYMLEQGRQDIVDFTGLDFSSTSITAAKNICPDDAWILSDCYGTPFDNNVFEAITALEVMEHLDEPVKFLLEMERILVNSGLLLVTVPNSRDGSKEHVWRYDKETLPALISQTLNAKIDTVVEIPPGRRYLFVKAIIQK